VVGELNMDGIFSGCFAGHLLALGLARGRQASDAPGVRFLDVSDPRRPRAIAQWRSPRYNGITAVLVSGAYAYACEQYGMVHVLDIRNPAAPTAVGTIATNNALGVAALTDDLVYIATLYQGLQVWNLANPAKPVRFGTPPSAQTMGYMKRRARRYLRRLPATDPARYVSVAYETLSRMAGGDAGVDFTRNWVAASLLYGGGRRLAQAHHGRGIVYVRPEPDGRKRLRLRTRAEQASAAWDTRPDLLAALLGKSDLPWPTHEMAARALRAQRRPLPALTDPAMLRRWLGCGSQLLAPLAVRAVVERVTGGATFDPSATAAAYFVAAPPQRSALRTALLANPPAS
jgi:hypothetical protein